MIIRSWKEFTPQIHPTARLADNTVVIGDVHLEENANIWYGSVLRGDSGPMRIGAGSNVQDNCVLHCEFGGSLTVGRNVTVGHAAILHGCVVEDNCLIGMGATILDRAVIGEGSIIGAGALVPVGKVIPPRSLVMGIPGKIIREVTDEELAHTLSNAEHYIELGQEQLTPAKESV